MNWFNLTIAILLSLAIQGFVIANVGSVQAAEPSNSVQKEQAQPPAPGEFEVDEKAVERALERTLIQRGVLLLPVGEAEIEPSFAYTRSELDTPILLQQTSVEQPSVLAVGTEKLRRDIFDTDIQLRLGMPFESQIELLFPYRFVEQSRVTRLGLTPLNEEDQQGSGFGDIKVGLAKTLLRESRWWPDLIARVAWDTDTGATRDGEVSLGGGFNEIIGALSAVKRQDPLAFVGTVAFQKPFEKDGIEPGQQLRFIIGTTLAASPETSLRMVLDQNFYADTKINGTVRNGSDQTIGILTFGASWLIGRRTLLDISTDIGLSDEAPDYSVRVSFGTRFTLFGAGL